MANSTIAHAASTVATGAAYIATAHHVLVPGDDVVVPTGLNTILWAIPGSDHTYTGISVTRTAGANLTVGQICYMGADGKMELSDADAAASMPAMFMATGTINENADGAFLVMGFFRDDTWAWATLGGLLYADTTTAGGMTQTAPAGAGDQVQVVGIVVSADVVWFNPSPVLVEVV